MMKPLFDRMSEGEGRLNKRSTAGIEREKKRLRERKKGWKRYMIKIREDLLPRKGMLGRDWRKKLWRDGGDGEGYFVIATNVSAVHCVLQRQPAFPCLLRSLYYPSMPWSFRDRIIFFAVNRNYLFSTKLVLLSTLIEKLDSRASLIERVSYDRPSWYNCL